MNKNALALTKIVFDEIKFDRKGFKNNSKFTHTLKSEIGQNKQSGVYRVMLTLDGEKKDEYSVKIRLSGFFTLDETIEAEKKEFLLTKNTVAILLPYLRSQLSVLTAQPDTDVEVLPVVNVNSSTEKASGHPQEHKKQRNPRITNK